MILANGDFPTHKFSKNILNQSNYIICCDGAVNQLIVNGLSPDLIIGDMDSINDSFIEKYSEKIVQLKRQSDTDLEKALKYCVENNFKYVKVLGFSGKRDDLYLSNIFLCFTYSEKLNIEMYSNFGSFKFVNSKQSFDSFKGQIISLFSNSKEIKIKTNYLKYHLNEDSLVHLYSGVSNESLAGEFSVEVEGGVVMVYQLFKE